MSNDFAPILRFMVVSDVHIKDDLDTPERGRFEKALKIAYRIARSSETYKTLDAISIVGDLATGGTELQMQSAKDILDSVVDYNETKVIISIASHEYSSEGVEPAIEKLKRIFGCEPDMHEVVKGYHFISASPSKGVSYNDDKKQWIAAELKKAANDGGSEKPIFVFQHPHNTGTVYGSIGWGINNLMSTYMNYPQIIHFSGHSHAPINDPRSIHQQHFTSIGTGTLRYLELDEFDKIYGTLPENRDEVAQMHIVEVDAENHVRVYPYDVLTDHYFPLVWDIEKPSDPSTFKYTNERYRTAGYPYFMPDTLIKADEVTENSFKLEFGQGKYDGDYVNSYDIAVKKADSGAIVKQLSVWSGYYFYNMPETCSVTVDGLEPDTEYDVTVTANSFWYTKSKNELSLRVATK